MIRAKEVREKHPHVMSAGGPVGTYCVGGAFLIFMRSSGDLRANPYPFPNHQYLAEKLRIANDLLSWDRAIYYAQQITSRNDAYEFEKAWELLDEALTFGQPPCPILEHQEEQETQEELVCV